MFDLLLQSVIELARALLIDALSGRIRARLSGSWRARKIRGKESAIRHIQRRNRERLLHRLLTDESSEL